MAETAEPIEIRRGRSGVCFDPLPCPFIGRNAGRYAGKRMVLEKAGVVVVDTLSQPAPAVVEGRDAGRSGAYAARQ